MKRRLQNIPNHSQREKIKITESCLKNNSNDPQNQESVTTVGKLNDFDEEDESGLEFGYLDMGMALGLGVRFLSLNF